MPTSIQSLAPGDRGTLYALSHMAQFVRKDSADPQLRSFAEHLVEGVRPHDFQEEVNTIYRYVQAIPYRRHPVDVQRALDAKSAIASGNLDCVSKSVLLATLLGTLGHVSRFAIIRQRGLDYDHVYVETNVNGHWLPLDPTPDALSGGTRPSGWEVNAPKAVYPIWPGSAPSMKDACCGRCASGQPCSNGLGEVDPAVASASIAAARDIVGLIMNIWQAHSAKVYAEDEISGAWTALGRPIIDQIKASYDAGAMTLQEATSALDLLYHQFLIQVQPISKYQGHNGFIPDPLKPRPGDQCNWACGTSWDLYWELDALKKQMASEGQDTTSGIPTWRAAGFSSKADWKAAGKPAPTTSTVVSGVTGAISSIPKEYLIGGAALIALLLLKK